MERFGQDLHCARGVGWWRLEGRLCKDSVAVPDMDIVVTAKPMVLLDRFRQQGRLGGARPRWWTCAKDRSCDLRLHGSACLPQASSSDARLSESTSPRCPSWHHHCRGCTPFWGYSRFREHGNATLQCHVVKIQGSYPSRAALGDGSSGVSRCEGALVTLHVDPFDEFLSAGRCGS